MINRLKMVNYRAFREQEILPSKLTLLFGPNNSGKSCIISAIALLSQTLRSADPDVPLLFRGELEDLGTYRDAVYGNDYRRQIRLSLGFDFVPERRARSASIDLCFGYRSQRREVILTSSTLWSHSGRKLLQTKFSTDADKQVLRYFGGELNTGQMAAISNYLEYTHFLPRGTSFIRMRYGDPASHGNFRRVDFVTRAIANELMGLEFIGPLRAAPSRTYLFSGENPASVGRSGEHSVEMLVADSRRRGKKKRGITESVAGWYRNSGMASDLDIKVLTDRHFELTLRHPTTNEAQNIADVGYGCSQVLPILVGGFSREPGTTFIVEEPEIHLHPRAQAALGDFFVGLAQSGIQCIVETHSEHMLLRIQSAVAAGTLEPSDVAVYYVYAPNGEGKAAVRLDIGKDGFFASEWPEGFFPERLEEAKNLARASVQKEAHNQ